MKIDKKNSGSTNDIIEHLADKISKDAEVRFFKEGTDASYIANWTEKGLFFHAKATGEDAEIINEIWEMKGDDFQMLFPQFGLKYIYKSNDTAELSIKLWNMPRTRFVSATSEERSILLRFLRADFSKFCEFFEYISDNFIDCYGNIQSSS
jgi:hypothetical protein